MRVLLLNPAIEECKVPHYGLAMLSAVLKEGGHDVTVVDYHFLFSLPPVQDVLLDVKPDVVGISMFSVTKEASSDCFDLIRAAHPQIPVICGGPHTACYSEELSGDGRIDYIVVGEAESVIVGLVEEARRQNTPQIIRCDLPDVAQLPLPDYTTFLSHEMIEIYPLVTSRGCPYQCTFCAVSITNSKTWRARDIEPCISELQGLGETLPNVREVVIWDDNYSLKLDRGKALLQRYLDAGIKYVLRSANMRADKIDEELILLLKANGCEIIQLGAEHGDPEVFANIRKGETLEEIAAAAFLAKKHGMKLYLSFIIGLPGDSVRKTVNSVRFALKLEADLCYWNILVPYKGTKVYEYFKTEGRVDDSVIPFTLVRGYYSHEPNAETDDFLASERVKAHKIAQILTERLSLGPDLGFMFICSVKYGFFADLIGLLVKKFARRTPAMFRA